MKDRPRNLAQSVRDRLKAVAVSRRLDYNLVLTRYVLERLLFRLGASAHRGRFALKGAMLFAVWTADIIRPTRDLDLLGFGDSDPGVVRHAFVEILGVDVPEDGVTFDLAAVRAEPIRAEQLYEGVRVTAAALIGSARVPVQIDIGFGDAVTPGLQEEDYPTLLDAPAPRLRTYPRETVVAEKFEALAAIGARTSRMKDYYDLYCLPRLFGFDGGTLADAIRATFARRETGIPQVTPPALSSEFAADPDALARWSAFVGRTPLLMPPPALPELVRDVAAFVMPPALAARGEGPVPTEWHSSDGWTYSK